jgi:transcriptional regulator with XRE-family HTH domain
MASHKAPEPVDKYIGNRVRMRRLMLGLSQKDLAGAIGLTFAQVQKYEKGTSKMAPSRLQQVANVLQVPIAYFFEGAPNPSNFEITAPQLALPVALNQEITFEQPAREIESIVGSLAEPASSNFIATADELALVCAFVRLPNDKLKRDIVKLVNTIAGLS